MGNQKGLLDRFFLWTVGKRNLIIRLFQLTYLVLFIIWTLSWYFQATGNSLAFLINEWALKFGEIAVVTYSLTLIPGIARRFRIQHKLIAILMIFRRYIGILSFMLIFVHASTLRLFPFLVGTFSSPLILFEIMGLTAAIGLFLLAITSNDWSTKHLGIWWNRIHALTYLIMWFVLLHVALQEINLWAILIGGMSILELSSFVASRLRKT